MPPSFHDPVLAHASNAADVVDLIFDRQACLPCLKGKSGGSAEWVTQVLMDVLKRFTIRVFDGTCDGCSEATVVHRLDVSSTVSAT